MSWPWNELGLPGPAGLPDIRSAYAQKLKTAHPEEDPEGFQRLHAAYQEASRQARRARSAQARPPIAPLRQSGGRRPPAGTMTSFLRTRKPRTTPRKSRSPRSRSGTMTSF